MLVMQVMDILLSFPALILGLIIVALLGPSQTNLVVAIALTATADGGGEIRGVTVRPATAKVAPCAMLTIPMLDHTSEMPIAIKA